jgi:hypothetical protein
MEFDSYLLILKSNIIEAEEGRLIYQTSATTNTTTTTINTATIVIPTATDNYSNTSISCFWFI